MSLKRDVIGREVARFGREVVRYGRNDGVLELEAAPGDAVVVQIAVNDGPISGIAVSPDGSRLMVTNFGSNSVSVIDTDTCRVVQTVDGVNEPYAIAVGSEDAERAYVSTVSPAYDAIGVIDVATNTVVATHPLALSVSDLAVSPCGRYVYASRSGARGADVAVLDTTTDKVEVIDVADSPNSSTQCVRVSSDGSRLYVATNGPGGGRLVVVGTRAADDDSGSSATRTGWRKKNTKSRGKHEQPSARHELRIIDTVEIGLPIRDVALSTNGAIAYVASCDPDVGAVVDFVDTRTIKITHTRKVAEIAGQLTGLTISGDGDRAYLVSDDGITVLCTLTHDLIGTISVATQPSCAAESQDGRYLYIADYDGGVTVAPIAGIEDSAHDGDSAVDWTIPELMQYEAALV